MIQLHLNKIQEKCNLTSEQLNVVREEMIDYAYSALIDSSIADQVFNISISESDQEVEHEG